MMYETFCIACVIAPIALLASTSQIIPVHSLTIKDRQKRRKRKRILFYTILFFNILSILMCIYFMGGGCSDCS